jgi:hypothetical protein
MVSRLIFSSITTCSRLPLGMDCIGKQTALWMICIRLAFNQIDNHTTISYMYVRGLFQVQVTITKYQQAKRALEADHMWSIVERMQELRMPPNAQTFSLILERPLMGGNLEIAVQYLGEMKARGIVPELQTAQNIIILAANLGHSRLALDIASAFEDESVRRLDNEVWLNCLISSAENLFVRLSNNSHTCQFNPLFIHSRRKAYP